MYVTAVNEQVLSRSVGRSWTQQKDRGPCDLLGKGHAFAEGNFGCVAGQFFVRSWECIEPLPIEGRHHLGGHDGVHPDLIRKELYCPFACQRQDRTFGRRISRSSALSCKCCFGTDVDDGAA